MRAVLADSHLARAIEAFVAELAPAWRSTLLAQKLVQLTMPGVADTYQGTELVDLSLVDPDNRRPVDYAKRAAMLRQLGSEVDQADLLGSMSDGRVKLFVTREAVRLRRDAPGLFSSGEYTPVYATGSYADRVFAFERRSGG